MALRVIIKVVHSAVTACAEFRVRFRHEESTVVVSELTGLSNSVGGRADFGETVADVIRVKGSDCACRRRRVVGILLDTAQPAVPVVVLDGIDVLLGSARGGNLHGPFNLPHTFIS